MSATTEKRLSAQSTEQEARFGTVLTLDYARSEVGFRLPDGREERISLETAVPTEFVVDEPVLSESGDLLIGLEILKFELVGRSETLWPGEEIRVLGGAQAYPDARPILGSVVVPFGREIENGVPSEQLLYLRAETPLGVLTNETVVRMRGNLYGIPPVGSKFESSGTVPLLDATGERQLELWACANEA